MAKTAYQQQASRLILIRRMRAAFHHFIRLFGIAVFCSFIIIAIWLWQAGIFSVAVRQVKEQLITLSGKMGMRLEHIYVQGHNHLPTPVVLAAMDLRSQEPLLGISLEQLRSKLHALGWVREVSIERQLPGTLHVRIHEREPIALWQNKGEISLIDRKGNVIVKDYVSGFSHLPLLVGEDAPLQAEGLLTFLSSEKDLMERVDALIRVGDRRWNVRFKNNLEVKLPEENPDKAWHLLAGMQREKKILDRAVKTIDLRVPDRMFIEVMED